MASRSHRHASWILPLLLLALPATAQAQFSYITNDGSIMLTRYIGPGGAVTIPSTIDGLPVTSIGRGTLAFTSVTKVTIPDSVTSIGEWAFSGCSGLTSITIPNSVTNIEGDAFYSCTSLTNITLSGSIISLANGVFISCTNLTDITIPNSVTSIGEWAFAITGLTSLTLPNSVTNISSNAFSYCASLTNVTIPNSVTSIGDAAFDACARLSSITVDPLNPLYSSLDGVLFDKSQTTLIRCPGGKVQATRSPTASPTL